MKTSQRPLQATGSRCVTFTSELRNQQITVSRNAILLKFALKFIFAGVHAGCGTALGGSLRVVNGLNFAAIWTVLGCCCCWPPSRGLHRDHTRTFE
eukprot:2578276-Amphidinium_carterae.1